MAIKYAENTSYNQASSGNAPTDFSAIISAIKNRFAQKTQAPQTNATPAEVQAPQPPTSAFPSLATSLMGNYKPVVQPKPFSFQLSKPAINVWETPEKQQEAMQAYINSGVPVSTYAGQEIPSGTTLEEYQKITGEPYAKITEPSNKPYLTAGKYLTPSEVTPGATIKTLKVPGKETGTPEELGQYLIEPSKPGAGIATTRPSLDYERNQLIRQGLDPNLFQIDHMTPLWAGGVDTMSNKEILDNRTHEIKSKIQSVPYTLMASGLISQREALSMASQWRTQAELYGDKNIPDADPGSGLIDIKTAQKIAKEWKKPPKVTWKSFVGSIPEAQKIMSDKAGQLLEAVLPKGKATAIPRELAKGFVSGAIPGASFAMPQLDVNADYGDASTNTAGAVSHALGSLAGNLTLFGLAYKAAVIGLSKVGFKWAQKELMTQSERAASKFGPKILAEEEAKLAAEKEAIKKGEEVSKKTIPGLKKAFSRVGRYFETTFPKAATLGVVSAGIGQTRQMPSEARLERAIADFSLGLFTPVGRASYTLRGYASIATPALTISLIEGLNPANSYANAMAFLAPVLVNTGTMVGLHGLGQVGTAMRGRGISLSEGIGKELPVTAPEQPSGEYGVKSLWGTGKTPEEVKMVTVVPKMSKRNSLQEIQRQEKAINESANRLSLKWREIKKEELIEDLNAKKITAKDFGLENEESLRLKRPKSTDEIALERENAVLNKYMELKSGLDNWDPETLARERAKVFITGRQLYKGGLNVVARSKADLEDLISFTDRMKRVDPNAISKRKEISVFESNLNKVDLSEAPTVDDININRRSPLYNAEISITGSNLNEKGIDNVPLRENTKRVDNAIKDGDIPSTDISYKDKNGEIVERYIINGFAYRREYKGEPWVQILVPVEGKLIEVGSVPKSDRINGREYSFHENALKRLKDQGVEGVPASQRDITPEFIEKHNLARPEENNEAVARIMDEQGVKFIKAPLVFTPVVKEALKKGESASFFKMILNDSVWDGPTNKKFAELSVETPSMTPEQGKKVQETFEKGLPTKKEAISKEVIPEAEKPAQISKDVLTEEEVPTIKEEEMPPDFLRKETSVPKKIPATEKIAVVPAAIKPIKEERIMEENPEIVKNDNPAEALASNFEEQTNNQIESEIRSKSFGKWNTEKTNEGVVKMIDKELAKLIPDTPLYNKLVEIKKDYHRDVLTIKAKEIFNKNKGNERKSVAEFKEEFIKPLTENGFENPLKKEGVDRAVTKIFRAAAYSTPKKVLRFSSKGASIEPVSNVNTNSITEKINKYNAGNNTKLDLLYTDIPGSLGRKMSIDSPFDEMRKTGYVPMGVSGNNLKTLWGVKFDKSLGETEDDFIKNFFINVLGFPEDVTADVIIKRAKLFLDESLPNPIQGETYTHHVITPPWLNLRSLGFTEKDFPLSIKNGLATPKAVKEVLDKNIFDGKIFMTKGMMTRIFKEGGYSPSLKRLKPTMDYVSPSGEKIMQKGDISIMDDHLVKTFEDIIRKQPGMENFKISDNDIITFPDNVKIGLTDEAKKTKYSTFKTPSDSYRFKYFDEPKEKASFSISNWAKFSKDDGLNEVIKSLYAPYVLRYKEFVKELNASKTVEEGREVLNKYNEYGKETFGEDLYGAVKKMVANGAWNRSIGNQIDKMVNKVFQEKVMSGSFLKGNHLTLTPDFKSKLLEDGTRTFLSPDEVMISDKQWKSLGEPKYVLTVRYPITRLTAMTKAKVLIAEKHGINHLGMEQIIPSHYDTFVRKEGDYDADAFHVFAIGGKDGIPMEVANKIESVRKASGDMVMDPLEKFDKTPLTSKGLRDISEKAVQGGDSVAEVAGMVRILPTLVDQNFLVKGRGYEMRPVFDVKNQKLLSELSQFSTDAIKSPSLRNRLDKEEVGNVTDDIVKSVFTNVRNSDDIKNIKKAIFSGSTISTGRKKQNNFGEWEDEKINVNIHTPFQISKKDSPIRSNSILADQIKTYNKDFNENRGPVQEIMSLFDDMEPYNYNFKADNSKFITRAQDAVLETFGTPKETKNTKSFQASFKKSYINFLKDPKSSEEDSLANFKKSLINYYREKEINFTPEEKRSIQIWLASSPDANLANKARDYNGNVLSKYRNNSKWSNKLDEIITDSEDIAQTYYKTFEGVETNKTNDKIALLMADFTKNNKEILNTKSGPEAETKKIIESSVASKYPALSEKKEAPTKTGYVVGATFDHEGKKYKIVDFPGLKLAIAEEVGNPSNRITLNRYALLSGSIGSNLKNPGD